MVNLASGEIVWDLIALHLLHYSCPCSFGVGFYEMSSWHFWEERHVFDSALVLVLQTQCCISHSVTAIVVFRTFVILSN